MNSRFSFYKVKALKMKKKTLKASQNYCTLSILINLMYHCCLFHAILLILVQNCIFCRAVIPACVTNFFYFALVGAIFTFLIRFFSTKCVYSLGEILKKYFRQDVKFFCIIAQIFVLKDISF